MGKIELVDILPTEQEIVNYGKYISGLNLESDNEDDYETPYTIADEEDTEDKINRLIEELEAIVNEMNKGVRE